MNIFYGIDDNKIDISMIIIKLLKDKEKLIIPNSDVARYKMLNIDPCPNIIKKIYITDNISTKIFEHNVEIVLEKKLVYELLLNNIKFLDRKEWWNKEGKYIDNDELKLNKLHNYLKLTNGSFNEEYAEQIMSIKFIKSNNKVLEIGSNIGRKYLYYCINS